MTRRTTRWAAGLVVAVVLAGGCSEPEPAADDATTTTLRSRADCSGDGLLDCARASTIGDLVPDAPEVATGEPITLGMVNQENTAAGSFPELSQAVETAVAFVNDQLGGVGGRPLEISLCNTEFSTEGSTACGQQLAEQDVPAVLGGIDVFGNAVDVLDDNGIPYIGGIPVSTQSMTSPTSYQWSGGTWGATVAFAEYAATELDVSSVAIVYGDFGSIAQGAEYGRKVLEDHDITTQMIPFPITATDVTSSLQAAAASEPDAIFLMAADTACKPALEGIAALGTDAQAFYVGACAAPTIVDDLDPEVTDGAIFNVEGPLTPDQPDFDLYAAVVERYGDGLDPVGAGTVSFRAFMNLYAVLVELGPDATAEEIIATLDAKVDEPSFMGHDYTCDHEQFEGLPAACSPQQVLGQMQDRTLEPVSGWIDVGAAYAG